MLRDALGRTFEFPEPPKRVVSLVPSLTETLFDLGAGESVVAISDFCIFPAAIERPRVGGTKNPRVEAIRALHPDLVHMNLEENLERHAKQIEEFAPVFVTEPKTVEDVSRLFAILGAIHHRSERGARLADALEETRRAIQPRPFTFACGIWKDPWMWCGADTYVSDLVTTCGGTNVLQNEKRYPSRTLDEISALAPHVIFLPDEPYLFTGEHAREVQARTGANVVGPFPGHLFTWHGSRTILGLQFLRETLDAFENFG